MIRFSLFLPIAFAAILLTSGHDLTTVDAATMPSASAIRQQVSKTVKIVRKSLPSVVMVERFDGGMGSGCIVDSRGYILTNQHVVSSQKEVIVTLFDKSRHLAAVVFACEEIDLAIIKINSCPCCNPLPAFKLSKSAPKIGDDAIAIGHPQPHFERFTWSVTKGIISGLNRTLHFGSDGSHLSKLIQTDAALNPGNSGGPLLNMRGELVGINAAIIRGSQSMGFAIDTETVRDFLRDHLPAEPCCPKCGPKCPCKDCPCKKKECCK